MEDYSHLSDQELMSKINGNNQSSDLSTLSDEQLMSKINGGSDFTPESMPAEPSSESQLNLGDDLKWGFADDKGKEKILRDKFAFVNKDEQGNYLVGQNPGQLQTVFPDSITADIPGKIARHINDINTITGSIIGAGIGSPSGPGGAIAGSGVGSGVAEMLNKAIGKTLGVNSQDPKDMATDIVISSAFGAGGEGVNQALMKAGEKMMPAGLNMLKKVIADKPIEEQPFIVKTAAKLLNFSSNVKEDSVLTALEFGPDNVLAKGNGSDKHLVSILDNVSTKFKDKQSQYGQMLGDAKREMIGKVKQLQPTSELQSNIHTSMQELGLIDKYGVVNKDMTGDQKAIYNKFAPLFKQLGGIEDKAIPSFSNADEFLGNVRTLRVNQKAEQPIGKLFQVDSAARMSMDSEIDSQSAKNFYSLVYGNKDPKYGAPSKGLADLFSEVSDKVGLPALKEANAALSQVKGLKEGFRKAGVDISNPRSLESFVKSGASDSVTIKKLLSSADQVFNSEFTKDIRIFDAAKDMSRLDPHFFRFGIVGNIMGLNALRQPGVGSLAYLGAAILGGTPYGAGLMLKGAGGLARAGQSVGRAVASSQRADLQTLARLIQSKTNPSGQTRRQRP